MKILKILAILMIIPSFEIFAQFSLETFLSEPYNYTISSIKERLADKKPEEKEIKNYKAVVYYDWLDPVSVKVGYVFTSEGMPNGRMISNGRDDEGDAKKLYDMSKFILIKIFGSNYSEENMFGITMITWNGVESYTVTMMMKGTKTMLTIMKM